MAVEVRPGLINRELNCYVNAIVYALSSLDSIVHRVRTGADDLDGFQCVRDVRDKRLLRDSEAARATPCVTSVAILLGRLRAFDNRFARIAHHDAEEACSALIRVAALDHLVGHSERVHLACTRCFCGHAPSIHALFIVELNISGLASVRQGLANFQAETPIPCGVCGASDDGRKRTEILPRTDVFVIRIQRVATGGNKIQRVVPFEQQLTLGSSQFRLKAVVVHEGASSDCGHYFTCLRDGVGDDATWWRADDATMRPMPARAVESLSATLLFYERAGAAASEAARARARNSDRTRTCRATTAASGRPKGTRS